MRDVTKFLNLTLNEWESIAKIIGFLAAAVFFVYKTISGYLITNLSIRVDCRRQHSAGDDDYLVVRATLSKGERGSVNIHDAQASVTYDGKAPQRRALIGLERLSYTTVKLNREEQKQINWDKRSETSPFIRLSPGEEAEVACYWEVPCNAVCTVEVVVAGKRLKSTRVGQWRSSHVSLPLEEPDSNSRA